MSRELLQQALTALRISTPFAHALEYYEFRNKAIKDIEAELAKPEQDTLLVDLVQEQRAEIDRLRTEIALNKKADNARELGLDYEPEQEPVAWVSEPEFTKQLVEGRPRRVWWECNTGVGIPFYTAPPRKKWQAVNGKLEVEPIKGTLLPQAEKQEHQFKYTPYGLRADESGNLSIGELPRKEWVGLTDEERNRFINYTDENFAAGVLWAEAKLKEKNT